MNYIYACHDCEQKARRKHKSELILVNDEKVLPAHIYEQAVLFETSHRMKPTEAELLEATVCPRCKGNNCSKSFHGFSVTGYTRGYGWLDKAGVNRDMNLYQLTQNDPYGQHRQPGEADHLASQLRKAGKHNPKPLYSVGKSAKPQKKGKKK